MVENRAQALPAAEGTGRYEMEIERSCSLWSVCRWRANSRNDALCRSVVRLRTMAGGFGCEGFGAGREEFTWFARRPRRNL